MATPISRNKPDLLDREREQVAIAFDDQGEVFQVTGTYNYTADNETADVERVQFKRRRKVFSDAAIQGLQAFLAECDGFADEDAAK